MKSYPEYKDSGIKWIGMIPGQWSTIKFRWLFNIIYRYPTYYGIQYEENGVLEIRGEMLENGKINLDNNPRYISKATAEKYPMTSLQNGDLVMSVRGTMGKVGLVTERLEGANITANLLRLSPEKDLVCPEWLTIVIQSEIFTALLDAISPQTTIKTVTIPNLTSIILPIPPLPEQEQIANYLEDKTSKIDTIIEKIKHLIGLLKEERTAVINQAVTKGLDPDVPMKDSGIEWLGEIPKHWEVKRFKYSFNLITDKNGNDAKKQIALENIESWTGRLIETSSVFDGNGTSFRKGDILFGKLRPYLAKVLYANFSGSAVGDIYVFRPTETVDSRFGFYRLITESFIDIVNGSTYGAKMPRASWDFIGNLKIAIPKLEEQNQILQNIEKNISRINLIISKSEKEIELLQEYRTALISEVVTGKIDVREEKV